MTANLDEIERLSQALALVEGFQLLILECQGLDSWGLHGLFAVVKDRVAELRGVPPLIVVYDPTMTTNKEGSLRDEAWVDGVIDPVLELSAVAFLDKESPSLPFGEPPRAPPPPTEGTSVVAVIDGTRAAYPDSSDRASWEYLFHRLNEKRNALTRSFAGTLALALTPELLRLFLEEAPDVASIRSGIFALERMPEPADEGYGVDSLLNWYPAHLVQEAALRRLAADPRLSDAARDDLCGDLHRSAEERYWLRNSNGAHLAVLELLLGLFSADELRRFASVYFGLDIVEQHVAFADSTDNLAEQVLSVITVDRSFFELLVRERSHRYREIAHVASQWGYELLPLKPQRAALSPAELREALLLLSREQLEQVVLMAGLAGQPLPTRSGILDTRLLSRASVRSILARAESDGSEALRRLSQALEIVASRNTPA